MAEQTHRIRVRYAESDQMGVAHHAAYVTWLEEARIAWMRSNGLSYRDIEASGTMMPVTEVQISYLRPARFDDVLEFATTAKAAGPSRVVFSTVVSRAGEKLATASVTVAAVGRDGKPIRIPDEIRPLFG
jgi:acyl-CoA thioester hydrolase